MMIYIIGIGPGNNIDYLTIHAYKTIEKIDIGIYIGDMIGEDIKNLFKNKKLWTGNIDKSQVIEIITNSKNKTIGLLMPGDTSLYSGQYNTQYTVDEYITLFNEKQYAYEIIPGISSMNALCAKSKVDLSAWTRDQNMLITSIERLKDTKQINVEKLKLLFRSKLNLILYQSFGEWELIYKLLLQYYDSNTKIIFGYKISWDDEIIIETILENAQKEIAEKKLEKHTIIMVLPIKNNN